VSVEKPTEIPRAPGVYEFLDARGQVLYVGKAKNLAARLGNYFTTIEHPRTRRMLEEACDLRWTICASETEALVLEREWIAAKQPPYNVLLRAGDGYSGIAISREAVPRLYTWRGRRPVTAELFGPYPGAGSRDMLDALQLLFGVRSCTNETYRRAERDGRACLLGETGRCLAPCTARVSVEQHREAAEELAKFLRKPDTQRAAKLGTEMALFAEQEQFEAAARRRDQLRALEVINERQRLVGPSNWNREIVAVRRDESRVVVAVTTVRDGRICSVETYAVPNDPNIEDHELLEAVLSQLGDGRRVTETATATSRRARGARERGLVNFTATQAAEALRREPVRRSTDRAELATALRRLAEMLQHGGPLVRIECMDISHTKGSQTVGAVVVLENGEPNRREYRTLHLGDFNGDDYAAISELVARRFSAKAMGMSGPPDLLLIDGGPGQVASAERALADLGVTVTLAGLAKRLEEIWPAGSRTPLLLEPDDQALRLLTLVRDEAHRHAIGTHRRLRGRAALKTGLDGVAGLGKQKREALLARFGSLDAVASLPETELATVPGIGPVLARRIREALTGDAANTGGREHH
jgi:excinuclease ABC subunit C